MDIKKNFQTAVKELLRETEEDRVAEQPAPAEIVAEEAFVNYDQVFIDAASALLESDDLLYEEESSMYSTPTATSSSAFVGSYSAEGYNDGGYNTQRDSTPSSTTTFSGDMQTSLICADTLITGNISTTGHINLAGSLNGNLEAKGDVKISGQVAGNIKGDNIDLVSCVIKGDTVATNAISINSESRIIGDVVAGELIMDGKIKGNVTVENNVILKSHATVIGNVMARSISVEGGAVLRGEMLVQDDQPEDDFEKNI